MPGRVPYSAAQPGGFTLVPSSYVSQLMRQVEDPLELKVTLLLFYLLSRAREYPAYATRAELELRAASVLGIAEEACAQGVDAAVQRGVILRLVIPLEGQDTEVYFANIEADIGAIEEWKARLAAGGAVAGSAPVQNIFELYEQNVGVVSPMIAEELKDAQQTYPAGWIEEAFREAVRVRKLNWKYISRILERWTAEGKDSGANRPGARSIDRDKYVKGRYGHLVQR
ncbi:MAG: DnaD domain protein [Chloroflexi bacterium]|nr:DnaD domain protein [Chloroflexota bacterium]